MKERTMINTGSPNPADDEREGLSDPAVNVRRSLSTLHREGAIVELRAFGLFGDVVSGHFDDHDELAREAVELDSASYQVYVTFNEVDSSLSERVTNRIVGLSKGKLRGATTDANIARRRWLLVDVDPERPPGEPAAGDEKQAAYLKAKECLKHLKREGWPKPIIADSGNGFHLVYPVELTNDAESQNLVKRVLQELAVRFDDDRAHIDTAVHNAARLTRLYGTTNRKGKHTRERPHRRSRIIKSPEEAE